MSQNTDALYVSVYYPQEVTPGSQNRIHVYIFKESAANAVKDHVEKGHPTEQIPFVESEIPERWKYPQACIFFEQDGSFRQISLFSFNKDWIHIYSDIKPTTTPVNHFSTSKIILTIDGIVFAEIIISILVTRTVEQAKTVSVTRKAYETVFCSYSHSDIFIAERVERVGKVLELGYLQKVVAVRSKAAQDEELWSLIDRAESFQLFWSEDAAQSEIVGREWHYALQLARPNFIRPVYWTEPTFPAPPELASIPLLYHPDLWIELKYTEMPLEQLRFVDERRRNRWRRVGFTTVGEVIGFLERLDQVNPMHVPGYIITDIDNMMYRLEEIGAWPPKHLQKGRSGEE